jgi:predicted MFS family arabinose efflux permease
VFLPFVAGYYVSYAFRAINALIGPQIAADLGLGAAELGFLTSVYFLAIAISLIPLGALLDRHGPRRVDATLLVVAAVGACVYATAESIAGLVAGRALIGLGVAVALMASFQAFVLWYPGDRIATLNSRAFAVGILGLITVTVPLEALLRVANWRSVMLGFAAFTLAAAALILLAVPKSQDRTSGAADSGRGTIATLVSDGAFLRIAAMASGGQAAVVALSTLWMATWLRDVAGYGRAEVARSLLVVSVALIAGYLVFGRLADARAKRGAPVAPVVAAGLVLSSVCLALLALGVRVGALFLWAGFTFFATAATLGYSMLARRFPKHLAGRVNTTLNTFVFSAMFLLQWLVGLVLAQWPRAGEGYSPAAYGWALALVLLFQLGGLAWFWRGRRVFDAALS